MAGGNEPAGGGGEGEATERDHVVLREDGIESAG